MVNSWIEWTRKNIDISKGYPKVTSVAIIEHPWEDKPEDTSLFGREPYRHDLLAAFTDVLTSDPGEFATRFTALHYYFTHSFRVKMERKDPMRYGWDNESEAEYCLESSARALEEDLASLVRSLPVENVPVDWRIMQWEILNSYLVRNWTRAKDLYDRAEKLELLERSELQGLRGQFRFLKVYFSTISQEDNDGLDSLQWEPEVYNGTLSRKLSRETAQAISEYYPSNEDILEALAPDQMEEFMGVMYHFSNKSRLFNFGVSIAKADLKLGDQDQEWLEHASVDLKSALEKKPDFPSGYRSILAGSYLLTGHFHDAAKQYERLIELEPCSSESVYQSLALSYLQAGEPQRAIEVLEECAQRFPGQGHHLRKAEIQAKEADYEGAKKSIRKEFENNPDLDRDWKLSALLGLAETRQNLQSYVDRFLDKHPDVPELTGCLLQTYWSHFLNLGDQARKEWKAGILFMYYFPSVMPQLRDQWYEKGAAGFAKAVELELMSKIFSAFRDAVRNDPELQELSLNGKENKQSRLFCRYLVGDTNSLSLGQMSHVLHDCKTANKPILPILHRFHIHAIEKFPVLMKNLWQLDKILSFRNPAAHGSLPMEDAEKAHKLCQDIVNSMNESPKR